MSTDSISEIEENIVPKTEEESIFPQSEEQPNEESEEQTEQNKKQRELIRRRIRLDIAYKGTNYHGWQRHRKVPTVQGKLEAALEKIIGREGELQTWITGSSRTDAGVHALQQVGTFTTISMIPAERFSRALNSKLPQDIRVLRSVETDLNFHPIRDCVKKQYCYLIDDSPHITPFLHDFVWDWRSGKLNHKIMHEAAQVLLGEHDFAGLQTKGSPRLTTVRTIFNISVKRQPFPIPFGFTIAGTSYPPIVITVEGSGFLYHMVRAIAGTLADLGKMKLDEAKEKMRQILETKDRSIAGDTAPAAGLYLTHIDFREDMQEDDFLPDYLL